MVYSLLMQQTFIHSFIKYFFNLYFIPFRHAIHTKQTVIHSFSHSFIRLYAQACNCLFNFIMNATNTHTHIHNQPEQAKPIQPTTFCNQMNFYEELLRNIKRFIRGVNIQASLIEFFFKENFIQKKKKVFLKRYHFVERTSVFNENF